MSHHTLLFTILSFGFIAAAGAQEARSIDRAAELVNRLQVEKKVEVLREATVNQTQHRLATVIAEFKRAGLSAGAQAELEKLAEGVAQRVAESWSENEAVSRFTNALAASLPVAELDHATVLYSEPRNASALGAICKANDAMNSYIQSSSEAASRQAFPELLQAARKLR